MRISLACIEKNERKREKGALGKSRGGMRAPPGYRRTELPRSLARRPPVRFRSAGVIFLDPHGQRFSPGNIALSRNPLRAHATVVTLSTIGVSARNNRPR